LKRLFCDMEVSHLQITGLLVILLGEGGKCSHVVCSEEHSVKEDIGGSGELVFGGIMGSHVNDGVDIGL
jgi:hypothetical protein